MKRIFGRFVARALGLPSQLRNPLARFVAGIYGCSRDILSAGGRAATAARYEGNDGYTT